MDPLLYVLEQCRHPGLLRGGTDLVLALEAKVPREALDHHGAQHGAFHGRAVWRRRPAHAVGVRGRLHVCVQLEQVLHELLRHLHTVRRLGVPLPKHDGAWEDEHANYDAQQQPDEGDVHGQCAWHREEPGQADVEDKHEGDDDEHSDRGEQDDKGRNLQAAAKAVAGAPAHREHAKDAAQHHRVQPKSHPYAVMFTAHLRGT
mmetsp:Transcript_101256/g.287114  ORF Transcript_101256/g.287114 Transcript_101256/m.287114 type:complete len:203 (-) Transcript_101256:12-620(-)